MTYEEMARKIENGNRMIVLTCIRKMPPLDAFLCAIALKEILAQGTFNQFWRMVRMSG